MRFLKNALRPVYELITSREVHISSTYSKAAPLNQKIPNVVFQFAGQPILEIFKDILIPASKADVWRYCILFEEGGIYCDIDSALTIPFRQLLADNPSEMLSFESKKWRDRLDLSNCADPGIFLSNTPVSIKSDLECPDYIVLNWLLCFEKGNPILSEVINLIVRHADFYRGKKFVGPMIPIMHFTGPLALTQAVWMRMQKSGKCPRQFGMNYSGRGIWKLRGMDYKESPHHSSLRNMSLLD